MTSNGITNRRVTFLNLEVVQTKPNIIEVRDVSSDAAKEKLETRERVTRFSIGFDHLVVVTTAQVYIYGSAFLSVATNKTFSSARNWNTPVIVELKEKSPSVVMQCEKLFLVVDGGGLFVFNYEGRNLAEVKVPNGAAVRK